MRMYNLVTEGKASASLTAERNTFMVKNKKYFMSKAMITSMTYIAILCIRKQLT